MATRSRPGLTVCPRCRAHVQAGERPSTTVCPFCEAPRVGAVGRSGVLAGALLAFACAGPDAPSAEPEPRPDEPVDVFEPSDENIEVEAYGAAPLPEDELPPEPDTEDDDGWRPPPDDPPDEPMYGIAP
ncbi:MAG: hypothetical protein VYE22_31605 [Myxococcota bacterium]|nr:hypothetical protein [Myxococcota bacterium]